MASLERFFINHWAGLMTRIRSRYWRHRFRACGEQFFVGGKIRVKGAEHITIGDDVQIAEGVYINARAVITIGDHVRLSAFVRINTRGLDLSLSPAERLKEEHTSAPVTIRDYAWLATGVIVNPGVTIGEGAVVGAGAVVTQDLPPYTLCVGIPAKPVRELRK
jgi:galactoside O-acetyltransferase